MACRVFALGCVMTIGFGCAHAQTASAPATRPANQIASTISSWLGEQGHHVKDVASQKWAFEPLEKQEAEVVRKAIIDSYVAKVRAEEGDVFKKGEIRVGDTTLRLLKRNFGVKPANGWPMYISMHGGGNAPKEVNDSQWQNQIRLYQPENSLYIAPRAPGDTWNLWHESRIDPLFDRLISDAIVLEDVDPDRVYLMGYSAGGDGVYQLAPRMADRFAAASMMAGHPNQTKPEGLRNLPFAIHVGALDEGYGRNKVALEWKGKLDALHQSDPEGYVHEVQLHSNRAHWMNREDAVAVPWMAKFTRNKNPTKIVWRQGDTAHDRFYWLALPSGTAKKDQLIVASRSGQTITVEKVEGIRSLTILLNDTMLDLDQPVSIQFGQKTLFKGVIRRSAAVIAQSLLERGDPSNTFCASVTVELGPDESAVAKVDVEHLKSAVDCLKQNMPPADRALLDDAVLTAHAASAIKSRDDSAWRAQVPDELFKEFVLPYAVINETRDSSREKLAPIAREIVRGTNSPGQAAQKLNAELFERIHVRYHATRRPFPNQSAAETMACGFASCTGLSIVLVDACRSVNIPARLVAIASWNAPSGPTFQGKGGNHTWVEIWDGRQWRFIGASEPSELDKTWFVESAARSKVDQPEHAIFASRFTASKDHIVLAWSPEDSSIPAVNVTDFYTARTRVRVEAPADCTVEIRDGDQLVAAGAPGEFILARGHRYVVIPVDSAGKRRLDQKSELVCK